MTDNEPKTSAEKVYLFYENFASKMRNIFFNPIHQCSKKTFLCYSSKDKLFVEKLASVLTEYRCNVWYDKWSLNAGDSIIERIQDAINECSYFIPIFSKHSIKSKWVREELSAGLLKNIETSDIKVIPIVLEDFLHEQLPSFIKTRRYIRFKKGNYKNALSELLPCLIDTDLDLLMTYERPNWELNDSKVVLYFLNTQYGEFEINPRILEKLEKRLRYTEFWWPRKDHSLIDLYYHPKEGKYSEKEVVPLKIKRSEIEKIHKYILSRW